MSPEKPNDKRLPRTKRAKNPPRFTLVERDFEILHAVLSNRFLSTRQVWWLFPDSSEKNLTVRLRDLYHHGYLDRIQLPVSSSQEGLIYAMTEKGAGLLAEHDGVDRKQIKWNRYLNKVQPTHIQHLLAINDMLISYQHALTRAKSQGELKDFLIIRGDPKQHKLTVQLMDKDGHRRNKSVIPDAILLLQPPEGEHGVYFIEVDRGTMSTGRWQEKVEVYREFTQSAQLEAKWHSHWAILLTVTTSEKRLVSIAEKTVASGGRRGYWFTTFDGIAPDSALAKLWLRGTDLFRLRNEQVLKQAEITDIKRLSLLDALRFDNG